MRIFILVSIRVNPQEMQPEICYLQFEPRIDQAIGRFQSAVVLNGAAVQVVHPTRQVHDQRDSKHPVQLEFFVLQRVLEAAPRTVLVQQAVGYVQACAVELH